MIEVVAAIMGGGRGERLFPLTKDRCKPAVPLGGKYRLIDVPITNCIQSGIRWIYLLTQYKTSSLHKHITSTYKFDTFSRGFVSIQAAEQTFSGSHWYQGTADAVRKNLQYIDDYDPETIVILSGDQLYRMDYREILSFHKEKGADVTLAAIPVSETDAHRMGLVRSDEDGRVESFCEKPKTAEELEPMKTPKSFLESFGFQDESKSYLANMGIYVFRKEVLMSLLKDESFEDFGKHVLPSVCKSMKLYSFVFQGYWEDIGTIDAFYRANLELTDPKPAFDLFQPGLRLYTHARYLPPALIESAKIERSLLAEGSRLSQCELFRSVLGIRSVVGKGSVLKDTILMGADSYDILGEGSGIGEGCRIERAIIDKNVKVGDGVVIENMEGSANRDAEIYYIRDGITVIPKNVELPDGFQIKR